MIIKYKFWLYTFAIITLLIFAGVYLMVCSWPLPIPSPVAIIYPQVKPPKEMAIYKIQTGVIHRTAFFGYRGGSIFDKRDFTMNAVLIRHPKGDLLIDAGFGSAIKKHFSAMPFYFRLVSDLGPSKSAAEQLEQIGYEQKNLKAILLTHAHWDHVSGIPDFPKVPVWVNKEEFQFIKSNDFTTSLIRNFQDIIYNTYDFVDGPFLIFPKSYDVYKDGSVIVVPAPGHTPGSTMIFVHLYSGEKFAFIGDLCWQMEGIAKREERPWLQSVMGDYNRDQVRELILQMYTISKTFPDLRVIPAHDIRTYRDIPDISQLSLNSQ